MINTLIYDMQMPVSGAGFQEKIITLLPELRRHYGTGLSCDGMLTFPWENSTPISMDATTGLHLGSEGNPLQANLDINCATDETAKKEKAVTLVTGINLDAKF